MASTAPSTLPKAVTRSTGVSTAFLTTQSSTSSPAASPIRFGGEEGLEDASLHLRGHAAAGIGDAEHEVLSFAMRLHLETAAVRHGIDGIGDEVGEQMPHEPWIGPHLRGTAVHLALHL